MPSVVPTSFHQNGQAGCVDKPSSSFDPHSKSIVTTANEVNQNENHSQKATFYSYSKSSFVEKDNSKIERAFKEISFYNSNSKKEESNISNDRPKRKQPNSWLSSPKVAPEKTNNEENGSEISFHEPFFYARWISNYPKTCFFVTLGAHGFFLLLLLILVAAGVDIMPLILDRLPLQLRHNPEYLKGLAWENRNLNDVIDDRSSAGRQIERTQFYEAIELFFEIPNGNVLKKKHLKKMKKVERTLWGEDKFQNSFCMTSDGTTCLLPTSVVRLFDGTFSALNPTFYDPDFENIENVLYLATNFSETNTIVDYSLGANAKISSRKAKTSIVRVRMSVGFPLRGYDSINKNQDDQDGKLNTYYKNTFINLADGLYTNGVGKMDFYYASASIISIYITNTCYRDMVLVVGSFIFIFLFMWFQTRSFFITSLAIFSIMNGFIITDILYIGVFRIQFLGNFHILSLFIILGIGADDVFVFLDTWTEAGFMEWPSLAHRLDHTFRRAGSAMLYTSLTTALAFFVSAASPFLVVSTFGIFSGILVIVNYLSVMVFFPCCVVMNDVYVSKKNRRCCLKKHGAEKKKDKNVIIKFLAGPYFRFITHKVIRWVIVAVFSVLIAVLIFFATRLEVQEEQLKFLPETTNIGAYLEKRAVEFNTAEVPQRLFLVWGLEEQDISNCNPTSIECDGQTVFNNKFQLNDFTSQRKLLNLCDNLMQLPEKRLHNLGINVNPITNLPEVNCFVDQMQDFLEEEEEGRVAYNPIVDGYTLRYPLNTDLSYPVNESTVTTIMDSVDYIYNSSLLPPDFNRWFEIAMSHWLYDGFQLDNTTKKAVLGEQYAYYSPLLGVSTEERTVAYDNVNGYLNFPFKYGSRLRYIAITVNLTINPQTLGYPTGLKYRDSWQNWLDKQLKAMPPSLKHGFQCTPTDYYGFNLWHWLYVQQELTISARQGIVIGLCVACPILMVATMNIVLGLMATFTISLVPLSVIAFIPIAGWKLGILESLNLVLVVGLSVDYCVHVAEGYARCKKSDRLSRVQSALEEVGISVLSGCLTTLGASFFLMLAIIIFFVKFGIFMFVTIGCSVLYSLLFFMTLLGLMGPQNNFGSITPLWNKIKDYSKKKLKNNVIHVKPAVQ